MFVLFYLACPPTRATHSGSTLIIFYNHSQVPEKKTNSSFPGLETPLPTHRAGPNAGAPVGDLVAVAVLLELLAQGAGVPPVDHQLRHGPKPLLPLFLQRLRAG